MKNIIISIHYSLFNSNSCNSVYFCSDQCREDYESIHAVECDVLKRIQGMIADYWQRTTVRVCTLTVITALAYFD